jgi:integrase
MECLRLRVKDIDRGYNQSVVRDGKGERDRITLLPATLKHSLAIDAARRILTVDTESQPAEESVGEKRNHLFSFTPRL